jgi:hypothetical protein
LFERDVVRRLEAAGIDYFVTGSVALGVWATFRQTNDVDMVVRLTPEEYESRLRPSFEPDYVVNPLSKHGVKALGAVISVAEGMKADMIVRQPDVWGESAFARRVQVDDPAFGPVWVCSAEDLIIAKLEFSEGGRSSKQIDDCRVLVRTRPDLDWEYLELHARALRLERLLDRIG